MGLFSRRREPVATISATWQPDSEPPVWGVPGYLADDDGCASEDLYRIQYWLETAPGASLILDFYVSHGAEEGTFTVGYRYEYADPDCWKYTGWDSDREWRGDFEAADTRAEQWANRVAAGERGPALAEVFGWDGQPW